MSCKTCYYSTRCIENVRKSSSLSDSVKEILIETNIDCPQARPCRCLYDLVLCTQPCSTRATVQWTLDSGQWTQMMTAGVWHNYVMFQPNQWLTPSTPQTLQGKVLARWPILWHCFRDISGSPGQEEPSWAKRVSPSFSSMKTTTFKPNLYFCHWIPLKPSTINSTPTDM